MIPKALGCLWRSEYVILLVIVPLWYLASAGSVIFLKETLTVEDDAVSAVIDATSAQLLSGVFGGVLFGLATDGRRDVDREAVKGGSPAPSERDVLLLASAFDVAGTAATNWAIIIGGASLSQIFKLIEPPLTVVISFALIGERTSLSRLAFMMITCTGVYFSNFSASASRPDPNTSPRNTTSWAQQVVWVGGLVLMGVCFPLRNVYSKRMRVKGAKAYKEICVQGFLLLFPVLVGRLVALPTVSNNIFTKWKLFLAMSFLSATYNLLSFKVLSYVTPVTHAQLRLGKRIVSVLVSILTFRDFILSPVRIFGLLVAFAGQFGFLLSPPASNRQYKQTPSENVLAEIPDRPSSKEHIASDTKPRILASSNFVARALAYGTIAFLVLGTNGTNHKKHKFHSTSYASIKPQPFLSEPSTQLPHFAAHSVHNDEELVPLDHDDFNATRRRHAYRVKHNSTSRYHIFHVQHNSTTRRQHFLSLHNTTRQAIQGNGTMSHNNLTQDVETSALPLKR